ncbi:MULTISPECIES: histidinol dehydrogenase [Exiguobacterium]|uniref:histidinol dehydrogenase n=1 Tax=Exiguobacterium TaxID=33986 RepID=UPI000494E9D8|nr:MULTISPECIES: histidinol dehydrogenase [Exiguobacterium]TCI74032.1 histidinol dehydrogenase [Exiguobacterium sp. IPCI3]TCI83188.1 histidinol dehydrogenase [Exiguobacterium sp. IPCH1]TCI84242.1 histidinol dehydrogenase [Exiguobacterium sp. IPBC4]
MSTETNRTRRESWAEAVKPILEAVESNGDEALLAFTKKFDGVDKIETVDLTTFTPPEAYAELTEALTLAAERIRTFHERQRRQDDVYEDGMFRLGRRFMALDSVGVYVPGGTAVYPSSVLMNIIPAKVAGVKRVVMVTPPKQDGIDLSLLIAAKIAGADECYLVGGAQAVAALAFGTETIQPVDKIVGPGNAYVATAKSLVSHIVGIDSVAGPSEVLIIADETANPKWVAADLLAQAEHDVEATALALVTTDELAEAIRQELDRQLAELPRRDIAIEAMKRGGVLVKTKAEAIRYANEMAAEHVQLAVIDPEDYMQAIRHGGSFFLGHEAAEAFGDYIAGPNHVLPTSGTARFSSGLSVDDFYRRQTFLQMTELDERITRAAIRIAQQEQLDGHARAMAVRLEDV